MGQLKLLKTQDGWPEIGPTLLHKALLRIISATSKQMGDVTSSSSAGEYASHEAPSSGFQGVVPNEGQPSYPQGPSPVNYQQQQYQQHYTPMPNAFTNQFDMTYAQAPGRQGNFNMAAMGNALPQHVYRPGYSPGQQQRHGTGGMAHGGMQPMVQYGLAAQHYYMPQHQQMPQYYNAQLSTPQQQQQQQQQQQHQANQRQNEFYPNPVMMNQPHGAMTANYYYPSAHAYPNHNHSMHGPMTPSQFIMPDGTSGEVQRQSPTPGVGPSGYSQPESMSLLEILEAILSPWMRSQGKKIRDCH